MSHQLGQVATVGRVQYPLHLLNVVTVPGVFLEGGQYLHGMAVNHLLARVFLIIIGVLTGLMTLFIECFYFVYIHVVLVIMGILVILYFDVDEVFVVPHGSGLLLGEEVALDALYLILQRVQFLLQLHVLIQFLLALVLLVRYYVADPLVQLALYLGFGGAVVLLGLVVVGDEGVGLLVDQLSGGGL